MIWLRGLWSLNWRQTRNTRWVTRNLSSGIRSTGIILKTQISTIKSWKHLNKGSYLVVGWQTPVQLPLLMTMTMITTLSGRSRRTSTVMSSWERCRCQLETSLQIKKPLIRSSSVSRKEDSRTLISGMRNSMRLAKSWQYLDCQQKLTKNS